MIPIVTAEQMRTAEEDAFKHITPDSAMLEAGKALFEASRHFRRVLIIANHGNNGGDGFVCASLLKEAGIRAEVLFIGNAERLSPHAKRFFDAAEPLIIDEPAGEYDCIVDALFGIGFHGVLEGEARRWAEYINASPAYVISADIPSGLDATSGKTEYAVNADETVTFGGVKQGLITGQGQDYCGKITYSPINIDVCSNVHLIDKTDIRLPEIKKSAHKGTMGHLGVIAASRGMEGAGALCAISALRCSAGKVSLCVPEECAQFYFNRAPEVMLTTRRSIGEFIADKACVVFGPGIGRNDDNREMLAELLEKCTCPLVIDADGLYFLTAEMLKTAKCPVTVTPHLGEAARLFGCGIGELAASPVRYATEFAQKSGATVLLKSNYNLICGKNEAYFALFGCPGMATAGSGDVLAGICGGLTLLYGDNFSAAVAAAFVHGFAGSCAQQLKTPYAMTASDISESIYRSFAELAK